MSSDNHDFPLWVCRQECIYLLQSLGEAEDEDYLHLLYEHPTEITVYVSDNRLTLYSEVAEFWNNSSSIILPLSKMQCDIISGDVNFDQTLSIADIIMLQNGLVNSAGVKIWRAGDMDENKGVNVFDLIIVKKEFINSSLPSDFDKTRRFSFAGSDFLLARSFIFYIF